MESHVSRKFLCILQFVCFIFSVLTSNIDILLEKGTAALGRGQLSEALALYSEAYDLDTSNYLALFRRATANIALGRIKLALPDIERVIELNPGFVPAYKQKAIINIKLGNLLEARASLNFLLDYPETRDTLAQISELEEVIPIATLAYEQNNCEKAINLLNFILKSITLNGELLEMRASCHLKTGETQKGIQELRNSVHMQKDNREGILRVSILMYKAGLALQSLEEVRSCLKLDQDDKACRSHYQMIKKLAKLISNAQEASESEKWDQCVSNARKFLAIEKSNPEYFLQAHLHICHCGSRNGEEDAITACDFVLQKHPQSVDPYFDKAEAFINSDRLDDAIKELQKVLEKEPQNQKARENIERVQRLIKQSSKKDYYKILGATRSMSKKEIMNKYRKLAAANHPDRFTDKKEKEAAQKKFIEISSAKEVLTDPDMRAKYDSGIDPLDPSNQGGGSHGNPFGHGGPFGFTFQNFNPFEGGNFEFHFG